MVEVGAEKSLAGKVAVITGAGQGIGRAHALRLAEEGAKIVVNDLGAALSGEGSDATRAEAVAEEIRSNGGEAIANAESIADWEGARRLIESAVESFGRIDILVNNAGNHRPNLIGDVQEDDFDITMHIHLKGSFATIHHAAPYFTNQRSGAIVNTGSDSGLGHYGNSVYSAAKEGIAGLTRTVARDLGPYNVRCNMIRPAAVTKRVGAKKMSGLVHQAEVEFGFPSAAEFWTTKIDFPNLDPVFIADFSTWLCTDAASHINGRTFRVHGSEISLMSDPQAIRTIFANGRWDFDSLASSATAGQRLHGELVNPYKGRG